MNSNNRRLWTAAMACLLACSISAQSAVFLPEGEPVEIAPNSYGNKSIRMVMNAANEPVIAFGSSGHLYVTKWDEEADAFGTPLEIDAASNVFMSDAEGPRMASQGDYVVLT